MITLHKGFLFLTVFFFSFLTGTQFNGREPDKYVLQ